MLSLDSGRKGFRSNSAIDLQAAQRAKARAQYSAMARTKVQSGTASLRKFEVQHVFLKWFFNILIINRICNHITGYKCKFKVCSVK